MKFLIFSTLLAFGTSTIIKTVDRSPKIVGGVDADIHEFPFIVSLVWRSSHACGGSFISELWVLTAAHCEFPINANFHIEYATADLQLSGEKARIAYPELFIIHEEFEEISLINDIGLIKLKEPAVTGFHNPFAKLAAPGVYFSTGTPAVVAGWGLWSYQNFTQTPLQKLDLKIWHYRDCRAAYQEFVTPDDDIIYNSNICAGLPDFSKAHCSGDSGGPLVVNGVQVGIVSWSMKPCAVAQYPGVYTAVASYIDWISEKTGIVFQMQMFMLKKP